MKKLHKTIVKYLILILAPFTLTNTTLNAAPLTTSYSIIGSGILQGVNAVRGAGQGLIDGPPGYAATNGGIGWTITQNTDHTWHYIYNIAFNPVGTSPSGQVIFQADSNLNAINLSNYLTNLNLGSIGLIAPTTYTGALTGAPGSTYGYGFNLSTTGVSTLSFDSSLAPTLGDLLFKGIVNNTTPILAYNVDFGIQVSPAITPSDYINYVVVPGLIQVATPEPATWLILATLIGILIYMRKPGLLKQARD